MEYVSYHVEVMPDGRQVRVVVRDAAGAEAGGQEGGFGLGQVESEIARLTNEVAQESASSQEIQALGEALFRALFADPGLAEHFRSAFRNALKQEQGLRLVLDFDEARMPEVAALPWEFLAVPETPGSPAVVLATHPRLVLSRQRRLWDPPPRLVRAKPLRILLAVAAPSDQQPVRYEEVLDELRTLAQQPGGEFELLGEPLLDADLLKLNNALSSKPDILHFIGHGQFVSDGGGPHGELAMVGPAGEANWVRDVVFASLLERHVPAVVFLQACHGGKLSSARGLTGVASKVVHHNVPVVVAMQYLISNVAAVSFARVFYERLAAGDPIDKAAQEGRAHLSLQFPDTREFATPVLYMRAPDGQLYDNKMQPAVQKALIQFQAHFEAACKQIAIMSANKQLHDWFQKLEEPLQILDGEQKHLTSDPVTWDGILTHEPILQGIIDDLLEAGTNPQVAAENAVWVRQIEQMRDVLREAVGTRDLQRLKSVLHRLHSTVDTESSRVNTQLVDAADALRLDDLAAAIATVRTSHAQTGRDPEEMRHIVEIGDALSDLCDKVPALVSQHRRWQRIDDEIHGIEGDLSRDITELEISWGYLEDMTRGLYGDSMADWAISLRATSDKIGRALAAKEHRTARWRFGDFRSGAFRRFSQVDTDLLDLCKKLEGIGMSPSQLTEAV